MTCLKLEEERLFSFLTPKLSHIFSASQEEAKQKLTEAQAAIRYLEARIQDLDRKHERRSVREPKKSRPHKKKKDFMECGTLTTFCLSYFKLELITWLGFEIGLFNEIQGGDQLATKSIKKN